MRKEKKRIDGKEACKGRGRKDDRKNEEEEKRKKKISTFPRRESNPDPKDYLGK